LKKFIDEYRNNYDIEKEIPIWITETGYQESLTGVTEEQQAAYLLRILIWSLANSTDETANIEKVYIHCLQDTGFSNTNSEANYGIVDAFKTGNLKGYIRDVEMAAKDSYLAIDMYSHILNGAVALDSNKETATDDGYYWYKFKTSDDKKLVMTIWNNNEAVKSRSTDLKLPKGMITIYDMFGNVLSEFSNISDVCAIDVSYKPIYIVISEDKNIQNAEVSYVYEHEYDGMAKEPEVTVILGDKILAKDVDYVVSYYDNINVGEGKIDGINNYVGSIEKVFMINSLEPFKFEKEYSLLKYGEKLNLKVNRDVGVSWSSSNSNIASVDNGTVTSKGVGRVEITATFGNTKLTQEIFVWNVSIDGGRFHIYNDVKAKTKSGNIAYSKMYLAVEKTSSSTGKIIDYTGGKLSKSQSIKGKYLSNSTLTHKYVTQCLGI